MLRTGMVTLMITVMSAGSLLAEDGQNQNPLMDWLRGPSIGRPDTRRSGTENTEWRIRHAVVKDAARQIPEIRQTSAQPPSQQLEPAEASAAATAHSVRTSRAECVVVQLVRSTFSAATSQGQRVARSPRKQTGSSTLPPQPVYQNSSGPYSFASSAGYTAGAGPVSMSSARGPAGGTGPSSAALYPAPQAWNSTTGRRNGNRASGASSARNALSAPLQGDVRTILSTK